MAVLLILVWMFFLPLTSAFEHENCNYNCSYDEKQSALRIQVNCSHLDDFSFCWNEEGLRSNFNASLVNHLSTVGSNMTHFNFDSIKVFSNLVTLNLSSSGLINIIWDGESNSTVNIEKMDLSSNNLSEISEQFLNSFPKLKELGMTGNRWHCQILMWFVDWFRKAEKRGLQVPKRQGLICYSETAIHSLRYPSDNDTTPSWEMWKFVENCPSNCSCSLIRADTYLQVNCSNRNFHDFPSTLPNRTRHLYLENNHIKSFETFLKISEYNFVKSLYLKNNEITSSAFSALANVELTNRFVHLDLSDNKMTTFPEYVFVQIQESKLGGNPWNCDCESGMQLRNFLILHLKRASDINNITCSPDDPKHANKALMSLNEIDLCVEEENGFHYLDLINGILATMVVVVLIKLIYDWWHFKRTGQLPLGPVALVHMLKERRLRVSTVEH